MNKVEFTNIGKRNINLKAFENGDTLSKAEFDSLSKNGLIESYSELAVKKFIDDAKSELSKSEDSDEIKKSLQSQIDSLQKHRINGEVVYIRVIEKSIDSDLEKGGEGSKGGKVIGHTKSGKPVYAQSISSKNKYRSFSKEDHKDAASLHKDEMKKYDSDNDRDMYTHHKTNSSFHEIESDKE